MAEALTGVRFQLEVLMYRSAIALAAVVLATTASQGLAQQMVRAGTLTCDISPGVGFVIGSQRQLACVFVPTRGGPREAYVGTVSRFGLDIGATSGGQMVWAVYAPTTRRFGALAGSYGGAGGEATVGAGLGANVLIGGTDGTISLQPISIQGQSGLNLAVGVSALELMPYR
jgi:hypothetical protein